MNLKHNFVNILIIEDEPHNSRMLQGMVEKLRPNWQVLGILESVEESINWFQENKAPDLILMDIQLSDGICFSIFDKVELDSKSKIIFTTAYDEYAIKAFKVNSIDYLLKPIEEIEIEKSFHKFEGLSTTELPIDEHQTDYKNLIHSILSEKKEYRTRFLIAGLKGFHKLDIKDIAYFYSDNKLTFAVDHGRNEHVVDYTLEQLEVELNGSIFFRANRKMILHIDSIEKIINEQGSKLKIVLLPEPEFDVVVSRLKASEFKTWVGK